MVALADGKLLIGGASTEIGGLPGRVLARLHQDGSMDYSFDTGSASARDRRGLDQ
ncbi:MAG: hypothetical protein FJ387_22150 [Verrucomicrobia bacterium]|nr:hypothetical protein [Verrucomicrobiota bacterium]